MGNIIVYLKVEDAHFLKTKYRFVSFSYSFSTTRTGVPE